MKKGEAPGIELGMKITGWAIVGFLVFSFLGLLVTGKLG